MKFLTIIDFKDQFLNTFWIILKSEMKLEFLIKKLTNNLAFFKKYAILWFYRFFINWLKFSLNIPLTKKVLTKRTRELILEFILPFLTRKYMFLDMVTIISKILYTVITDYPKKLSRFFDYIVLLIDSIENSSIKRNYSEIKIKIVSLRLKLFAS